MGCTTSISNGAESSRVIGAEVNNTLILSQDMKRWLQSFDIVLNSKLDSRFSAQFSEVDTMASYIDCEDVKMNPLHVAAAAGNLNEIRRLVLVEKLDVNGKAVAWRNSTPLNWAAAFGRFNAVLQLIALGANPWRCCPHGAAEDARFGGDFELAKAIEFCENLVLMPSRDHHLSKDSRIALTRCAVSVGSLNLLCSQFSFDMKKLEKEMDIMRNGRAINATFVRFHRTLWSDNDEKRFTGDFDLLSSYIAEKRSSMAKVVEKSLLVEDSASIITLSDLSYMKSNDQGSTVIGSSSETDLPQFRGIELSNSCDDADNLKESKSTSTKRNSQVGNPRTVGTAGCSTIDTDILEYYGTYRSFKNADKIQCYTLSPEERTSLRRASRLRVPETSLCC